MESEGLRARVGGAGVGAGAGAGAGADTSIVVFAAAAAGMFVVVCACASDGLRARMGGAGACCSDEARKRPEVKNEFEDEETATAAAFAMVAVVARAVDVEAVLITWPRLDRDGDDANKDEYVARLFRHAVLEQIARPLAAFLRGFYDVVPLACLSAAALDASDLELAIAGLDDVDVNDWKTHTTYSEGFSSTHASVKHFWAYVDDLPLDRRAKLLQYVTGTSRVPAGGFARLQGRDGDAKAFELRLRAGGDSELPCAHTRFNRLDLPAYSSHEKAQTVFDALLAGDVLGFSDD